MVAIQINAGTLTASADDRTVTGLLVPYGEECSSNLGKFSVSTGAFTLPADPDVAGFNEEHVREQPIGRARALRETDKGIVATFGIAKTPEGDQALADIRSGKRKHLSAEVADVVIRAGKAVGGRVFGGALVGKPAFPSATLLAAAADVGEVEPIAPDDKDAVTETKTVVNGDGSQTITTTTTKSETAADGTVTETKTVTTETIAKPVEPEPADDIEEEEPVGVPNTLTARKRGASSKPKTMGKRELFTLLAAADTGSLTDDQMVTLRKQGKVDTMFAALADITYDGAGGVNTGLLQPEWIGEVWDGNDYFQKYVPLFGHADLHSLEFLGYKWKVKPHGGDWAGNKSEVPSNNPSFEPVKGNAGRYAMAHDIARELRDLRVFGDTSFFDAYFDAGAEDYKRWVDGKTLTAMKATAVAVPADNPVGLDIGPAMSALVDGAAAVIANNATPTFAVIDLSYWKQIAKTPQKDILGYLNAQLGLTSGEGQLDTFKLVPAGVGDVEAGDVYVGSQNAMTVRELPGVPLRADALDIARGGEDHGLFGYAGVQVNKPDAVVRVTPYTAP